MNRIKALREKRGLTQSQLAELAGTSQPQIKRLENGERELTVEWATRLAGHLGTTPVSLLFPDIQVDQTATPERRLRSALLAFGVDSDEIDQVLRVIRTYVHDERDADDERSAQTLNEDQPLPATRHREPTP